MRSLTGKHVKTLSEAVRILYTATEADDFGRVLIRAADSLFTNTNISVDEVMVPDGRVVHWADKDFPASTQELWPKFSHEHPAVKYIAGGGKRPVVAISDFLTQREFLHLGLYHEIYKPNGIKDQIAALVPLTVSSLGLAICGPKPFRQVEKDCLAALYPHLLPAYENYLRRVHMSRTLRLSAHALEAARDGIVVCSRHGRIRIANQLALRLLPEYFPRPVRAGRELPAAIKQALAQRPTGAMEVPGPEGVLQINWSPDTDSGFSLLLTETRRDSVREKARAHGLSPREREVAHWLAQGKTNDEIARALGISRHTSRTHVERILTKLQVSTRTGAVAKLVTAPGI